MFDGQPWFDGFRDLATNGVDKAVLNAFRMLGKLNGEWVETSSDHAIDLQAVMDHGIREKPDVSAVATRDDGGVSILVWNYHDDDVEDGTANVTLTLHGLAPGSHRMTHYRMDRDHSNALRVWQEMGSPQEVAGADFDRLEAAGQLAVLETGSVDAGTGSAVLATHLPRQGVSLIRIDY
jgi:xylan 1,4-beta-xylosidase